MRADGSFWHLFTAGQPEKVINAFLWGNPALKHFPQTSHRGPLLSSNTMVGLGERPQKKALPPLSTSITVSLLREITRPNKGFPHLRPSFSFQAPEPETLSGEPPNKTLPNPETLDGSPKVGAPSWTSQN